MFTVITSSAAEEEEPEERSCDGHCPSPPRGISSGGWNCRRQFWKYNDNNIITDGDNLVNFVIVVLVVLVVIVVIVFLINAIINHNGGKSCCCDIDMPKPRTQPSPQDGGRRQRSSSMRKRRPTQTPMPVPRWRCRRIPSMGWWCNVVKNGDGYWGQGELLLRSSCSDNGHFGGGGRRYQWRCHSGVDSRHMNIKKHMMCHICLCLCHVAKALQRHAKPWNIVLIFTDMMYDDVWEHALTSVRAWRYGASLGETLWNTSKM